ncbi:hypothetical protein PtA15_7A822 [Puccinia triticina]|uniref:Uncharacterized protein n=1 Tax=Puccinia triticina TaxID=208348 RepID=A0ABY7CPC3_9BASI|nr:uncharacterized protein PtA15_7A822 [Puccinia triticina]WAQ87091.1 hypothetical protein PtA15_7A822 [Puccinia triticina]WAR56949.1 hypothetical protein PtB15_7B802 [Puccinia triticina]
MEMEGVSQLGRAQPHAPLGRHSTHLARPSSSCRLIRQTANRCAPSLIVRSLVNLLAPLSFGRPPYSWSARSPNGPFPPSIGPPPC